MLSWECEEALKVECRELLKNNSISDFCFNAIVYVQENHQMWLLNKYLPSVTL